MDEGIKNQMQKLVDELNEYNYQYYVLNSPTISDYEFDMKLKDLERLEEKYGVLCEDSPTLRVGSDLSNEFKDVKRTRVMGSIANSYDYDELIKWANKLTSSKGFSFIIEPKYDGTSCSLIYENGILVQASTRGNGYVGSDVTENVKTIKTVPLKLKINDTVYTNDYHYDNLYVPNKIEIRGEILMPKSQFIRCNEERTKNGLEPFSNERNAAAGSLKQLDSTITAKRGLIFKPYGIYCDDIHFTNTYLKTQHDMLNIATIFGFSDPWYARAVDTNSMIMIVQEFENKFLYNQDYKMDGAVVKVDEFDVQEELGYSQKVPYWAKAFKFKQESISTILKSVKWYIGRSGKLTPVGVLIPVEVDGSTISNVTLNNIDFIHELDLRLGAYIFIEKGGAVIPKTTGVDYERCIIENIDINSLEKINAPETCPECGAPLTKAFEGGAHYYCTNPDCKERVISKLCYFVSKDCMNIDGLSEKTLRKLYDGGLRSWHELYYCTVDGLQYCGCGENNSVKLYENIQASKMNNADRVLTSIGIPMIGKVSSKELMEKFGSIKALYDYVMNGNFISELGDVANEELHNYMKSHAEEFTYIFDMLNYKYVSDKKMDGTNLTGMTILATGTLKNFTRDGIKDSVINNGGKYASSVSKKLSFMIVGSEPGSSKIEKAKELGVKMITEEEYLNII